MRRARRCCRAMAISRRTRSRIAIAERLLEHGEDTRLRERLEELQRAERAAAGYAPALLRLPYFCPGCPHSTSTQVPEGSQGAGRDRLPLHGPVDGPRHQPLHPDGRRGRVLAGRGAVQHAAAHVPERRRRHLLPFGLAGGPRRHGGRRQHHLQDPLQRRGRHDRRPEDGDRQSRRAGDHPAARSRGRAARSRSSPTSRTSTRWRTGFAPGVRVHHRDELDAVQRRLREVAGRLGAGLRPDLRRREAPPPQARRVPRSGRAGRDQRAGLRGLRRLRRRQQLRRGPAGGDRVRPQAPDRPVRLQQGLSLPQGLLPELRHRQGRQAAQGQRWPATCRSRSCRSRRCRRSTALRHRRHRRRRHRRDHHRGPARHGGPPRGQGRRRPRHGRAWRRRAAPSSPT